VTGPFNYNTLLDESERWAAAHGQLLCEVADAFLADGWPSLDEIGREALRRGDPADAYTALRAIAAPLGHVTHEDTIKLRARGLARCPQAAPVLDGFLAALKLATARLLSDDPQPRLDSADLVEWLDMDPVLARQVSEVIFNEGWIFGSGSGNADGEWTREITEHTRFVIGVETMDDYLRAEAERHQPPPRMAVPPLQAATPVAEPPPVTPYTLVADINDHSPFAVEWWQLTLEAVETFLGATDDDEPLHWEVKSEWPRPESLCKAVAGFANREGGYLIVGGRRDEASRAWLVEGAACNESEPGTWINRALRTAISPPPEVDVRVFALPDGRWVAVVQVQPNCGHLSVTRGTVYYRRGGETTPVEDGAELSRIMGAVGSRSRAGRITEPSAGRPAAAPVQTPPADRLATTLSADAFEAAVAARVRARGEEINVYLAGVQAELARAVADGQAEAVGRVLDCTVICGAVCAANGAPDELTARAIRALHQAFDLGVRPRGGPNVFPREQLWLELLGRARALGALLVRLEKWEPTRQLVLHDADVERPVREGWLRHGDVWVSRANLYRRGQNVLEGSRVPLRLPAEHAQRLRALRPDGVIDEDAVITSACQFDLLANLVSVWHAGGDPDHAAFPYFAAWDGERVRPMARRLTEDLGARATLLPGAEDTEVALLLQVVASRADTLSQGLGSWQFWSGFTEGKVGQFIAENLPAT
jgi:hypothetical protein